MTKKLGISLRDELYEWAARQVATGRADSMSALIAEGLEVLAARAQLEALVTELTADVGELDATTRARVDGALHAAERAYRRRLDRTTPQVA